MSKEGKVNLVNLTQHDISIQRRDGGGWIVLPRSGQEVRVAERATAASTLASTLGPVDTVRVAQRRTLTDLPDPQKNTRFVVSRVAAFGSRRSDLLFPHGEIRSPDDRRILGVRALARTGRWRNPMHKWMALQGANPSATAVAIAFTLTTALAGAFLGVCADFAIEQTTARAILLATGLVLVAVALLIAIGMWRRHERVRAGEGTAYFVEEFGIDWTSTDTRTVRDLARQQFSSVLEVPGPSALDHWHWPLDAGAADCSNGLDRLVQAFRVVRFNDDELTANGLFVTAHWPVAVGLGARLTNVQRGMTLGVRQRGSHSPRGRQIQPWDLVGSLRRRTLRSAHTFGPGAARLSLGQIPALAGVDMTSYEWRVALNVEDNRTAADTDSPVPALILLVRLTDQHWGPLPATVPQQGSLTLHAENRCPARFSTADTRVRELRLVHTGPPRTAWSHDMEIPWDAFPTLVDTIVSWIAEQGREQDRPILLGLSVPQEIGVGIGIAGISRHNAMWPADVWPLVWDVGRRTFVVPNLPLGRGIVTV